jgi:hypothetical protein
MSDGKSHLQRLEKGLNASQLTSMRAVSLGTTEALRQLKACPNKAFAFSGVAGSEAARYHGHSEGRVAFPMDSLNARGLGSKNLNIDSFGGDPFIVA